MKVPTKKQGNLQAEVIKVPLSESLNESPYEKKGNVHHSSYAAPNPRLNESPSEKEGKL